MCFACWRSSIGCCAAAISTLSAQARWSDPRAHLLIGAAWETAKGPALAALRLPDDPAELLAGHAATLDETYREVGGRLTVNTGVSVDADGKLHVVHLEAVDDPPSLVDLRKRLEAMLPRVDLPELILGVMSWYPDFVAAFTPVSGGKPRREADLHVTIAAVLTAHSLNVGYAPIISPGIAALIRVGPMSCGSSPPSMPVRSARTT
jgi:hypothetical protein